MRHGVWVSLTDKEEDETLTRVDVIKTHPTVQEKRGALCCCGLTLWVYSWLKKDERKCEQCCKAPVLDPVILPALGHTRYEEVMLFCLCRGHSVHGQRGGEEGVRPE